MSLAKAKILIVGPCALESYEQIEAVAALAKAQGVKYLRAQLFKPRTSPQSFQGLGAEGKSILLKLKLAYPSIKFVCEVCSPEQFNLVKDIASIIQVGARNMQNFELLKFLADNFDEQQHDYVLLKRGFANTVDEWIKSSEYLTQGKIPKAKLLLCERGSRSFTSPTSASLDFTAALEAQAQGHKVIIDPSHGSKDARFVLPLAKGALAMGFAGLMIEAHPRPQESVSDKEQAISLEALEKFLIDNA